MGNDKAFRSKKNFELNGKTYNYYDLKAIENANLGKVDRLPFSIRVLLESVIRQHDGKVIKDEHVEGLAKWGTKEGEGTDVPFKPSRVILQDFTGVPAVVDLASLRKAMVDMGGDPDNINPEVPVDLVIDHSVQVDQYGTANALQANMELEFERNAERYQFLNWATKAFDNYRAVPPATGIVHQVNLEYLADVVHANENAEGTYDTFPDTLVGTDSHTPMVNGLGVLGWGVGGIEAEAGMLGQPSYFPQPDVIGVKFTGEFPEGTTATDLALTVTETLRKKNVVGKFVEYYGPGLKDMPLADRATISNMAPEYGATCGFFPIDEEALNYLRLTGRSEEQIAIVEKYCKENNLWYSADQADPEYTETVEINLSKLEPSLAGPKRPQDRIALDDMQKEFKKAVTAPAGNQGLGLDKSEFDKEVVITNTQGETSVMKTGAVAIAAITSCTNTSNPYVMLGAGLLAKNAVEKGLTVPDYVKTSLAPGSTVVTRYLDDSGLSSFLDKLGFNTVGYGCTTCIGNSGPLREDIEKAIMEADLTVASVLSGNRNFEGRIHPLVKTNYLASPPLVVAYALAGSVDFDLKNDSLGKDKDGNDVYLKDIWPSMDDIKATVHSVVNPKIFRSEYDNLFESNDKWNEIDTTDEPLYEWSDESTYIQNPPFFEGLSKDADSIKPLDSLRVLGYFGDSITTDHISPAGAIAMDMPAGKYLQEKGVTPRNFNSYGSRRGNHEVMMRGTFANIRIRNKIAPGTEGGYTTYWPTGEIMPIYDAAMKYKEDNTGLVVLGGKDYGMGSSRDWAAKGSNLLGVKAVIAESYERIHRSNLVMMGVLPLVFADGNSAEKLGLTGKESFQIKVDETVTPGATVEVVATDDEGKETKFNVVVRFDSEIEMDYYRHGGILQMVLRNRIAAS
ncbi:aconitate hydratase AcnA [Pseudogracilibacillus auburnensis]|uniref:Aconitate hydratase n=1 Tax=Pseudogracilibacillus auburnensis TaxID=1494959 RepID=A0A2V3VU04_9BACI|nr:aconitate hydratase AcnA [Pseudogracilibacillus auburnensis]MBO1004603.1 aconitate hydratase AcnA [Pseudogracilibacillus auburnensis]PXW85156.1 aconitase [Pseudogracilibacillus auburnensis]